MTDLAPSLRDFDGLARQRRCVEFVMVLGSCLSCGTLYSTRVENLLVFDGYLIELQLAQAQINELLLVLHLLLWRPPWPCAKSG